MPLEMIAMDVRPGGEFRYTMVKDETGTGSPSHGTCREVIRPERLVLVYHDDRQSIPDEVVVTIVLTDFGDGRTEMHFEQAGFGWDALEAGLRSSRAGHAEEIDKLVGYLNRTNPGNANEG